MSIIYSPERSSISKQHKGISDSYGRDHVFKLLGCSVLSINCTAGFNGSSSSCSVTLVEDTEKGDLFIPPITPSLLAISMPRGGINSPTIYQDGMILNPDRVDNPAPFYFAGICNSYSIALRDIGGRTISVEIVDPRTILTGVQCILGSFMYSQTVGAGVSETDHGTIYSLGINPRTVDVNNIIDVFGYWNYGLDSEKNEYGMKWEKIREPIENIRVKLFDISFEFLFTGETFSNVPDFYRIDDQMIDIMALVQKVSSDSGSDLNIIARKVSHDSMLIEFQGIKRKNQNSLARQEIANFVAVRSSIVESVRVGHEFRNEPTSSTIIGGMRNSNYLALPSLSFTEMHLNEDGFEDYTKFPADIKVRLFGGVADIPNEDGDPVPKDFATMSGSIFPFWGFTPDDHAYPLIEPVLPLDHLVFDKIDNQTAKLKTRIPLCKISVKNFTVRFNPHETVFIDGDELFDDRPFAYLEEYVIADANLKGYLRGLPLNTEVLRAALVSESAFYDIYSLYYPDIADSMALPGLDCKGIKDYVDHAVDKTVDSPFPIESYLSKSKTVVNDIIQLPRDTDGNTTKTAWDTISDPIKQESILSSYRKIIYQHVRQYAIDHLGKRFIVCLPKSEIMQRIWNNESVPTRPERPQIEYVVDDRGYWEIVPNEFDGITHDTHSGSDGNVFTQDEEDQIRRKFMAEDGRFYPMVVMDWKPTGNINFNSNGKNKAMFQDFPVSEFRPNRIATSNPRYVFISCGVTQLKKRPDLAMVEMPAQITFDPTVESAIFTQYDNGLADDENIATIAGLLKYFWYHYQKSKDLQDTIDICANFSAMDSKKYASIVFKVWARKLYKIKSLPFTHSMSTEIIMDLKGIVIPLTSTIVPYGPWYYTYEKARGMVEPLIDESLVPWNFERSDPWYTNLDDAGFERLDRTLANIDYLDTASITVAGFPEFSLSDHLGYNSNITGLSIDFSIGGIKTTYNLSTYSAKPGTFNKDEYDNVNKARIDTREKLPDPQNLAVTRETFAPNEVNRFPN